MPDSSRSANQKMHDVPRAEQQERFKWAANKRADRLQEAIEEVVGWVENPETGELDEALADIIRQKEPHTNNVDDRLRVRVAISEQRRVAIELAKTLVQPLRGALDAE